MDFPADITLRKTRMKFELTFKVVLLFSYQGFVCSFFCDTTSLFHLIQKFLSRTFTYKGKVYSTDDFRKVIEADRVGMGIKA